MARRNEARTQIRPWLETLAWNAAALAALGAMLLVLLGSLEWLDRFTPAPGHPRRVRAAEKAPRALPVLAGGAADQGTRRSEACATPPNRSG